MNKYRVFIVIGVAALVIGRLISPLDVQAQDEESDGIYDQLRTMSQILESTLNDAINPSNFHLLRDIPFLGSVTGSKIRAEYIPTVGAIFTIPIRFPLHASGDKQLDAGEAAEEQDLWEHFSSTSPDASAGPVRDMIPVDPLKMRLYIEKTRLDEGKGPLRESTRRLLSREKSTFTDPDSKMIVSRLETSFPAYFMLGGGEPYDPVKINALTHTIIETIARYGHRLESIPDSEHILVVVEAPWPLVSLKAVNFSGDSKGADEDVQLLARTKRTDEKDVDIEGEKRDPRGRLPERSRNITRGTVLHAFYSGQLHDRRLLSFKKGDLQRERSYDSIKSEVETTDY